MEYKFVILGRLPCLNDYTSANRAGPHIGGRMKKESQDSVIWAIRNQLRGVHISKPVHISYEWVEVNRKRDLDNISSFGRKVIQDALVKAGVLQDDGWKYIVGFTDSFSCDKERPRVEVTLREV